MFHGLVYTPVFHFQRQTAIIMTKKHMQASKAIAAFAGISDTQSWNVQPFAVPGAQFPRSSSTIDTVDRGTRRTEQIMRIVVRNMRNCPSSRQRSPFEYDLKSQVDKARDSNPMAPEGCVRACQGWKSLAFIPSVRMGMAIIILSNVGRQKPTKYSAGLI